jgi:hypothetical protein
MHCEPKNESCAALSTHSAQRDNFLSVQFLRVTPMLCVLIGLLALSSTALAQVEPALPGSIEYSLRTNNETWVLSSAPIGIGTYVEDLLTDRLNQPVGRGSIGIVTDTGFDPDYNEMAAIVDFGRDYSAGIVFSELSAVEITPVPEPSSLLILLPVALLLRAAPRRRCG